ncbi:MAG: hypothetical protein IRY91_06030 [Gemmatimonadaceae bacterium]|nr:hypothetical protein [Gemmatimonadaceae bacterium]
MNRRTVSYSMAAAVLVFGLAACSSDSTGPSFSVPDAEVEQSVAADAGEAIATSVDLMTGDEQADGASASVVGPDAGFNAVTVSCSGPDGDGWFTCEKTRWNGLDVVRQRRFWEGTDFGLGWDPAATDSVNHRRTVTGSFTPAWNPAKTYWVNRADTATMVVDRSGSPVLHVWTGTGVRADSTTYTAANGSRAFHYTAYDTATAVAFAMPRSTYPWPQSGTLVHTITALVTAESGMRHYERTVTRRAVVTFNGTQTVPLEVGELTCTLDLATHAISGCH